MATVTIPARFNGPPDSGNGGYCCGTVAHLLGEPATTELRAPPPLDVPMHVRETDEGVELFDGPTLVARARPSAPAPSTPPATVTRDAAAQAVEGYWGFVEHAFPTCFVCGPERARGDGLRIFPGPVAGTGVAAAPWTPAPEFAGNDGSLAPEFVWSALDCPSWFGFGHWAGQEWPESEVAVAVLASMRIRQDAAVPVGEELVVLGWGEALEGRKIRAGSAIQSADGVVLAVADTLWIQLRDGAFATAG